MQIGNRLIPARPGGGAWGVGRFDERSYSDGVLVVMTQDQCLLEDKHIRRSWVAS